MSAARFRTRQDHWYGTRLTGRLIPHIPRKHALTCTDSALTCTDADTVTFDLWSRLRWWGLLVARYSEQMANMGDHLGICCDPLASSVA